jgi:hypothetical protein
MLYSRDYNNSIAKTYDRICKKQVAIRDMSTFTALQCMSINMEASQISEDVCDLLKIAFSIERGTIEDLLKITAYIVGISVGINKKTDAKKIPKFSGLDFVKAYSESNSVSIVETIRGLMSSHILKEKDYEFIRGPLMNILKCWIDKAGYTGVINEIKGSDEISRMSSILLQESYTLSEFWQFDITNYTSFFQLINEEYLLGFPHMVSDMCFICYHLLGNKEDNYSKNVMDLLSNFNSFVAYFDDDLLRKAPLNDGDYNYTFKQDHD